MVKSNNTQGNPYHDESGKFTSEGADSNSRGGKLDDEGKNPFKGSKLPGADEMEESWRDLFGLGQKIVDEGKEKEKLNIQDNMYDQLKYEFENGYTKYEDLEKRYDQIVKNYGADSQEAKDADRFMSEMGFGKSEPSIDGEEKEQAMKLFNGEQGILPQGPANVIKKRTPEEQKEFEEQKEAESKIQDLENAPEFDPDYLPEDFDMGSYLDDKISDLETKLIDLENRVPYGLTPQEQQAQKELEKQLQETKAQRNELVEKEEAMKLFNGEAKPSDEPKWKKLGYEEDIVDAPVSVRRRDDNEFGRRVFTAETTTQDFYDYLKARGVEVDDRTRDYLENSNVIPKRLLDQIGVNSEEELQEDFDEYMEGKIDDDAWEELY